MRNYPEEDYDIKDVEKMNAKEWMLEALKMNPSYCCWGPYEDYMCKYTDEEAKEHNAKMIAEHGYDPKRKGGGWDSRFIVDSWKEFDWKLDDYNELVNFYFEVNRASKECEACEGKGLNPKTKIISDNYYKHSSYDNNLVEQGWMHNITDDEVEALVKGGRLSDLLDGWWSFDKENSTWKKMVVDGDKREWVEQDNPPVMPTAGKVNSWSKKGIGHDSINCWILVKARAKRLGVYGTCDCCDGDGYVYTEPSAKLGLVLWMLHPRKGCSRGVHIKHIKKDELNSAIKYLQEAKERNADRFKYLRTTTPQHLVEEYHDARKDKSVSPEDYAKIIDGASNEYGSERGGSLLLWYLKEERPKLNPCHFCGSNKLGFDNDKRGVLIRCSDCGMKLGLCYDDIYIDNKHKVDTTLRAVKLAEYTAQMWNKEKTIDELKDMSKINSKTYCFACYGWTDTETVIMKNEGKCDLCGHNMFNDASYDYAKKHWIDGTYYDKPEGV